MSNQQLKDEINPIDLLSFQDHQLNDTDPARPRDQTSHATQLTRSTLDQTPPFPPACHAGLVNIVPSAAIGHSVVVIGHASFFYPYVILV